MTSGVRSSGGCAVASVVLYCAFLVIAATSAHANQLNRRTKLNEFSKGNGQYLKDNSLKRSKRYVTADLIITDRVARGKAHLSRQAILREMLLTADTASGGKCRCLLNRRSKGQRECHCNIVKLLSTFLRKLQSSGSKGKNFNELSTLLKPQTKIKLMKLVAKQLRTARRARAVEIYRLSMTRKHKWLRRRLIRKHSRSAFDGMQLLSF